MSFKCKTRSYHVLFASCHQNVTLFLAARRSLRWLLLVALLAPPFHGKDGLLRGGGLSTAGAPGAGRNPPLSEVCGSPSGDLALSWPSGEICTPEAWTWACSWGSCTQDPIASKSSRHPLFRFYTQPATNFPWSLDSGTKALWEQVWVFQWWGRSIHLWESMLCAQGLCEELHGIWSPQGTWTNSSV